MDSETVIILFAFIWGAWILFKIHRRRGATRSLVDRPARPRAAANPARSMPRMGKLGTMSFNQEQALRHNNFIPDKRWSFEEAALLLDGVAYLHAVCREVADDADGPAPLEVQNELLRFILTEQDLRDHVRSWGERRREDGVAQAAEPGEVPHNRQYDRIADKARGHLTG